MASRSEAFVPGEIYHCYNRGVDKRTIFEDQQDYVYFLKMMRHFNTSKVLGKLRLQENYEPIDPPVTLLTYCILPNHYHMLLRCNTENGVSKYLQRIGGGYTMYFNQKYQRNGSLFQGKFKSNHIDSDIYLKHILAYVRYNNIIHNLYEPSLFRASLNTKDELVRGLSSNFLNDDYMKEVVDIIKDMRSSRKDLELD